MKYQLGPQFSTKAIDIQEVVSTISRTYLPHAQLQIETLAPAPVSKPSAKVVQVPLLVQEERTLPKDNFTWSLTRRCPRGYRRNKKTQKCAKVVAKSDTKINMPKRRRCPNGTRKNKKTGNCDPK